MTSFFPWCLGLDPIQTQGSVRLMTRTRIPPASGPTSRGCDFPYPVTTLSISQPSHPGPPSILCFHTSNPVKMPRDHNFHLSDLRYPYECPLRLRGQHNT